MTRELERMVAEVRAETAERKAMEARAAARVTKKMLRAVRDEAKKECLTSPPAQSIQFNVYKRSEGGFGQRLALTLLRGEGIVCEPATSPYVGQTAVIVYGPKRVQAKAARILFNY